MRIENGMLREVYICTVFLRCRFIYCFICCLPGSTCTCRRIRCLQTIASHTLCAQKQINTYTWFYKDNVNDKNNK